ncbi:MAG: YjgN family protein [Myxococcota bacterium]
MGPETHPSMGRLVKPASQAPSPPRPEPDAGLAFDPLADAGGGMEDPVAAAAGEARVSAAALAPDDNAPVTFEAPLNAGMADDEPPLELARPAHTPPPPADPPAKTTSATDGSRKASFHGRGGQLLVIHLVNTLLSMITLGIYVFWGKVKVRRYLLGEAEFEGDRFEYHGTGKELWRGWMKAMLYFFVPFLLMSFIPQLLGGGEALEALVGLLQFALILGFTPLVIVGARRYRMSRTSWRGIRFSFRGPAIDLVKLFFKGALLSMVTLGFYVPIFHTNWQDFMAAHTYFGNRRFEFDGVGRDLYRPFLIAMALFPFTLGISWIWYRAAKTRYFWDHTTLEGARFNCSITGSSLCWLYLSTALLLMVTFGLAFAWVQVRMARYHLERVTLDGPLDLAQIQQDAQDVSAAGEELAGFFDLDLGWA